LFKFTNKRNLTREFFSTPIHLALSWLYFSSLHCQNSSTMLSTMPSSTPIVTSLNTSQQQYQNLSRHLLQTDLHKNMKFFLWFKSNPLSSCFISSQPNSLRCQPVTVHFTHTDNNSKSASVTMARRRREYQFGEYIMQVDGCLSSGNHRTISRSHFSSSSILPVRESGSV